MVDVGQHPRTTRHSPDLNASAATSDAISAQRGTSTVAQPRHVPPEHGYRAKSIWAVRFNLFACDCKAALGHAHFTSRCFTAPTAVQRFPRHRKDFFVNGLHVRLGRGSSFQASFFESKLLRILDRSRKARRDNDRNR